MEFLKTFALKEVGICFLSGEIRSLLFLGRSDFVPWSRHSFYKPCLLTSQVTLTVSAPWVERKMSKTFRAESKEFLCLDYFASLGGHLVIHVRLLKLEGIETL